MQQGINGQNNPSTKEQDDETAEICGSFVASSMYPFEFTFWQQKILFLEIIY